MHLSTYFSLLNRRKWLKVLLLFYSIEGRVAGGPAQFDLFSYPSRFDGANLVEIELVGVPLRIDRVAVQSRTVVNTRLEIDFPASAVANTKCSITRIWRHHPSPRRFLSPRAALPISPSSLFPSFPHPIHSQAMARRKPGATRLD